MTTSLDELKKKIEGTKGLTGNGDKQALAFKEIVTSKEIVPIATLPKKKKKTGRPTVMTPDNIRKIEEVAALGGSIAEMAMWCDIHVDTLYAYIKENKYFSDRIEALREKPILQARNTIMADIKSPDTAKWYLERKRKAEFGPKVEVETTTRILNINIGYGN